MEQRFCELAQRTLPPLPTELPNVVSSYKEVGRSKAGGQTTVGPRTLSEEAFAVGLNHDLMISSFHE